MTLKDMLDTIARKCPTWYDVNKMCCSIEMQDLKKDIDIQVSRNVLESDWLYRNWLYHRKEILRRWEGIPEWVNWLAYDKFGVVRGYERQPVHILLMEPDSSSVLSDDGGRVWHEWEDEHPDYYHVEPKMWQDSLEERPIQ